MKQALDTPSKDEVLLIFRWLVCLCCANAFLPNISQQSPRCLSVQQLPMHVWNTVILHSCNSFPCRFLKCDVSQRLLMANMRQSCRSEIVKRCSNMSPSCCQTIKTCLAGLARKPDKEVRCQRPGCRTRLFDTNLKPSSENVPQKT